MLEGGARKKIVRALRAYAEDEAEVTLAQPKDQTKAAPSRVRDFTHEEIWHRYDAVRAYEPRLSDGADAIHHYRSACRELRFLLELFGEALPESAPIAEELRALQDQVGEMHDHHVAVTRIEAWRARGELHASRELDAYVEARARARDQMRERLLFPWQGPLRQEFRARLARALEAEA